MLAKIKKVTERLAEPALARGKQMLKQAEAALAAWSVSADIRAEEKKMLKPKTSEWMTDEEFEDYLLQRGVWVQSDKD